MKSKNGKNASDAASSDKTYQEAQSILEDKAKLLENVMSSMGDGLSIQDLDMRIVYQNKIMIDTFGEHLGEYCYNIYERRDKLCVGCPIVEAYKTGKATKALRVGIMKDGTSYRFENIASVLKNEQGKVVAGMEMCRIVEEREKAFDDLKKKTEALERFNKATVNREMKMVGLKKELKTLTEKIIELERKITK